MTRRGTPSPATLMLSARLAGGELAARAEAEAAMAHGVAQGARTLGIPLRSLWALVHRHRLSYGLPDWYRAPAPPAP